MKFAISALALLAFAAPASAQSVEVGRANWDKFPKLETSRSLPTAAMVTRVEEILQGRQCRFAGQSAETFDIGVPYAVHFDAEGRATRILIGEMGCKPLETMVGQVALELATLGEYRPSNAGRTGWHAATMYFVLQ